ncbi:MAG: hypothetical protein WBM61_15310 [Woeseiaceae bacterium]
MNNEWLTTLQNTGGAIYSTVVSASPWTLLFIGLSLPFVALIILTLYRSVLRNILAVYSIIIYRSRNAVAGWKTQLVVKFRHWLPHRQSCDIETPPPQVDFDDLDIAVLKVVATLKPGFAISAPELAEQFRIRPAQVQRSLEKLRSNKMLDPVIGSNEGFDNYRLTQLGNAFMSTWARRGSHV